MKHCKNCTCEKEVTDIIVIFDRSGSMLNIQNEMVGAYNRFIEEQKKVPGKARVTLVTFDDRIDVLFDKVDLDCVRDITYKDVEPRAMTALMDAIGTGINKIDNNNVVMLIQTDGLENASREYSKENIKKLIENKKKIGWDISFIGADIDAFADGGQQLGIDLGKTFSFKKTSRGVQDFGDYMTATATTYRTEKK